MKTFYFTFGFGHKLNSGLPADNCYTIIEAEDESHARHTMNNEYGCKWAFCYKSAEEAGVDRFNLRQVEFGE